MPVTVEVRALHRAIDDLRTAVTTLRGTHGDIPAVARLQNDLERLVLDVADADALGPGPAPGPLESGPAAPSLAPESGDVDRQPGVSSPDEHYDVSAWGEDMDDEGVGGFHGPRSGTTRSHP